MGVKKIILIFIGILCTQTACDLKPKILSLPDTVGDFISTRYPALLADPNVSPEIYNSAVADYGVYASPELYGTDVSDDYVVYASVDDYIVPPQDDILVEGGKPTIQADTGQEIVVATVDENQKQDTELVAPSTDYLLVPMYGGPNVETQVSEITVKSGDTLYSVAQQYRTTVDDLAQLNGLKSPFTLKIGQKLKVAGQVKVSSGAVKDADVLNVAKPVSGVQTATKVNLVDVVVGPGDTLYSLSRKYSVPVNDLAVMNDLSAPFNLRVGQKIRVPDLAQAPVARIASVDNKKVAVEANNSKGQGAEKNAVKVEKSQTVKAQVAQPEKKVVKTVETKKISSDPTKKLPKITARSSSKFSWPVQGKILSNYGAKSNGLFNDGINISANRGSVVKAAENGVVAYAGNEVKGMGNLIIIQHDSGWMTVYAHLDSMNVRRGTKVAVGQKIGVVGKTGKVDSPQLHFEIRKGTKAYNPMEYLKK